MVFKCVLTEVYPPSNNELLHVKKPRSMQRSIRRGILCLLLISVYSLTGVGQEFAFYDDCECSTDGQNFEQRFSVVGLPFQNWELISARNFFMSTGPYEDFPEGTDLGLQGMTNNVYELTGFRIAGGESSITVTDGTDNYTYLFPETCDYPQIEGDQFVCEDGGLEFFEVEGLQNIVWSAPGLTLVGDINSSSIAVNWSNETVGNYTVSVSGDYTLGGNTCPVTLDLPVELSENNIADQLACNNSINLSLDGSCELRIVADMILEGTDIVNDAYDITVRMAEGGEAIPDEMITMEYLGVPLIVEVSQQCGGNSCWGTLVVEDKTAPPLFCPADITLSCEEMLDPNISGLPVPMGVNAIPIDDNSFLLEDFDFCGDATLVYYDELVDNSLCEGPYASIVERIWVLTDINGNTSDCSHFISVERADLNDVIMWPPNYDAVLPGALDPLPACGDWPALEDGHPSPDFTGYPVGTFCGNVQVTFEDTPLDKCSYNSLKIIRRWEVRDICGDGDDVIVYNQYIMTIDEDAPDLKEYTEEMIVEAEGHYCISDIVVPAPELNSPECSHWDYYVGYKFVDDSNDPFEGLSTDGIVYDNNLGLYVIENIPAENQQVWIVYVAEDECGNVSTTNIEVRAVDVEQPVPVCDLNTFVGLSEYGISHAGPYTFDDGSWDNCTLSHLEVRRMDGAPCNGTAEFSDKVHFCCDDVGQEVQVQLRAYDLAGNYNDCMVNVIVQDNIPPMLISCPADRSITCDTDVDDIPLYGSPVFTDECEFSVTHVDELINEGECGLGTMVRRTFTATDKGGNTTSCTQILTFTDFSPFNFNSINWPNDLIYTACYGEDIIPENLPPGFDEPAYNDGPCDQIAHNYTDLVFEDTDEACLKVLRKWKVVNNCTYESYEQTQVIKLVNNDGPEIDCDDVEIRDFDLFECGATVMASAEATDDCTDADDLVWTYIINDNSSWSGNSNSFERHLEPGDYEIVWTATDACGNTSECVTEFELEDTKAPTPICLEFVVTTIRETGESTELWASDFLKEATDDCTASNDLRVSFSENANDQTRTFNCDDLENGISDTLEIQVWVTDEYGNQDYCTSMLILQDNADNCPDSVDSEGEDDNADDEEEEEEEEIAKVSIAGKVMLENESVMSEVMMALQSTEHIHDAEIMTDETGEFAFTELDMYLDYDLTPSYDGEYLDGVSTLDLVMIQKHVLGIQTLDSPYKIIAADANNSESVTSIDLIELRKLILGVYNELPNNASWRFVDTNEPFVNPNSPFPFQESMNFNGIEEDYMNSDFVAVKIGDVNNTLQNLMSNQAEVRNAKPKYFALETQTMVSGEKYMLDITAESYMMIEGFQTSLNFEGMELLNVVPGRLNLTMNNMYQHENGLNISWNALEAVEIIPNEVLFTMEIKAQSTGSTNKVFELNSGFNSEIYLNESLDIEEFELFFRTHSDDISLFELHQNVPNPFNSETTVSFSLPKAQMAEIIISDYTGRVVYTMKDDFNAGLNQLQINSDELNTSGILYLQLKTNTHSGTQKMLLIK